MKDLPLKRVRSVLEKCQNSRVLVIGDLMLDRFIWGHVRRISPEAPVPVVDYDRESSMPGGAGNVARNLTSLKANCELVALVGRDDSGELLKELLEQDKVGCACVM